MIPRDVVDKIFTVETELETVLEKVRLEVTGLREENENLKSENLRLHQLLTASKETAKETTKETDLKWKEEASELLLLQRETLREFQRKYRRALLYADELQKRLRAI